MSYIAICDSQMGADLVGALQISPIEIALTLLGCCITLNFAYGSSFLLAGLQTCGCCLPNTS